MLQPSKSICESCKHSQMTRVEVIVQANKQEHGRVIPVGISRESILQPWCFNRGAGVAIQVSILECEGYEPAVAPKKLLKPESFEVGKEA